MTDPYQTSPASRARRGGAAFAAAALAGTMLGPALSTGPAAAAEACDQALPFHAAANADLLRLHALSIPGLGLGPLVDARLASSGAALAADAEGNGEAAAAAARDLELNVLGLFPNLGSPLVAEQFAPPANGDPTEDTRAHLHLRGLLNLDAGNVTAHATWDEAMACGALTGEPATASADVVDAEVLPRPGDSALVSLPQNVASWTQTSLVEVDDATAARASAAASLVDLQVFAGTPAEISVKVISEPTLEVTATGDADSSSVDYDAPVLEVTGPGVDARLDASGTHVDLAFATDSELRSLLSGLGLPALADDPLAELLGDLEGSELSQLSTDGETTAPALDTADELADPFGPGQPLRLGDLLSEVTSLSGVGELSVLRLSLGQLDEEITDESVSAAAASLRLQVLRWQGGDGPTDEAEAVLDLGVGLLEASASAPEQPEPTPPPGEGGECEDCPDELPVTGSTMGLVAGVGVLLAVGG